MKQFISTILLGFSCLFSAAQPRSSHSGELQLAIRKLAVTGSVLYIAAHPDDENTRLLTWLANEKKMRTGYLSLTRGDGGQNLIGKEQGEALGLIRTQELLAARRTDGAEQFFTRANDFGFSKNPSETFSFWNHDSILADVVYTIRRFRPDVIICRFPTTGEGGHGHHTASALLALEAYAAAADPNMFPWQLASAPVWQCRRVFWNTFNFGGTNTTAPDQLKIETGNFNVFLGKSYGEIAAESRSMHKSQGFGTARQRGSVVEYFKLLKGDSAKTDLFDGIDQSWNRVKNSENVKAALSAVQTNYDAAHPEASLAALIKLRLALQALDASDPVAAYWQKVKLKETEQLLVNAAGLWVEVSASAPIVVPGDALSYSVQLVSRLSSDVTIKSVRFATGKDSSLSYKLKLNENLILRHTDIIAAKQPYSEPYWLTAPRSIGAYLFPGLALSGLAENDAAFTLELDLELFDQGIQLIRPIVFKSVDPVKGEVYRSLEVLPALTITPDAKVYVFAKGEIKKINVLVKANQSKLSGLIKATVGSSFRLLKSEQSYSLTNRNDEQLLSFEVEAVDEKGQGDLKFSAEVNGSLCKDAIRRINYDHIPAQFFLEPSVAELRVLNVLHKKVKVAYIPGAGDDVAESLNQVGFDVTLISDENLKTADLHSYQAIITGVRAFNTSDKLFLQKAKLEEYMKSGGNLIVQYNTNSRVGPLQAGIGPYPFTISRERVTDEQASVSFLNPTHPVLNEPNKIEKADFEGWVQERGIYFAVECDTHYQKILSMHDPGEAEQSGSLIIAPVGKGNFIYTGLSLFRQLPAGVPGSYRLFANLISLRQNKQ